jgi:hypothetical protein
MMKRQPTTTHLKQGKAYPDPIATAKATGSHFRGTAKFLQISPTPTASPEPLTASWAAKIGPSKCSMVRAERNLRVHRTLREPGVGAERAKGKCFASSLSSAP